jgi:hypothetical protein
MSSKRACFASRYVPLCVVCRVSCRASAHAIADRLTDPRASRRTPEGRRPADSDPPGSRGTPPGMTGQSYCACGAVTSSEAHPQCHREPPARALRSRDRAQGFTQMGVTRWGAAGAARGTQRRLGEGVQKLVQTKDQCDKRCQKHGAILSLHAAAGPAPIGAPTPREDRSYPIGRNGLSPEPSRITTAHGLAAGGWPASPRRWRRQRLTAVSSAILLTGLLR